MTAVEKETSRPCTLVTRIQGREVSFSVVVINQLLRTSQDGIFSFNEVQVVTMSEKALSAED